jgi:RimJ/RimL family protein N-acetyltransferase
MGTFQAKIQTCKTGEDVTIRSATEADAEKINSLVAEVFKTSTYLITLPEEFSSFSEDQQKERIGKYHGDEGGLLLVAEYGSELIGTIDFQNGKRKRISHKGSFGMSVRSTWRGKGVGAFLLQGLIDWVKAHPSIEVIQLGVLEENAAAIALYEKFGFEKTGREPFGVRLAEGPFMADLSMSLRVL